MLKCGWTYKQAAGTDAGTNWFKSVASSDSVKYTLAEIDYAKIPCYNCGEIVEVAIPFIGCVYCYDCAPKRLRIE